jgi:putative transcriptional regulator
MFDIFPYDWYAVYVKHLLHFPNGETAMENKIKQLRKLNNISQEELAKMCGVSRQTINAIENNKYDPSLKLAFQLARALGVTVDELFHA